MFAELSKGSTQIRNEAAQPHDEQAIVEDATPKQAVPGASRIRGFFSRTTSASNCSTSSGAGPSHSTLAKGGGVAVTPTAAGPSGVEASGQNSTRVRRATTRRRSRLSESTDESTELDRSPPSHKRKAVSMSQSSGVPTPRMATRASRKAQQKVRTPPRVLVCGSFAGDGDVIGRLLAG